MDSRVSARVPVETRERGDRQLARIGATTTQLINAAYDYVIETGKLPRAPEKQKSRSRKLTEAQMAELRQRIAQTTCPVPAAYFAGRSDESILEEELRRDYEALA